MYLILHHCTAMSDVSCERIQIDGNVWVGQFGLMAVKLLTCLYQKTIRTDGA